MTQSINLISAPVLNPGGDSKVKQGNSGADGTPDRVVLRFTRLCFEPDSSYRPHIQRLIPLFG